MRYQIVIPPLLLVPILMSNGNHTSKIERDVIVTYSNHAEAEPKISETKTEIQIIVPENFIDKKKTSFERDSNEVVFVPNEKELPRNEDYLRNNPIKIEDYMVRRSMDVVMDNGQVRVETEPSADILFLSGKNNENENIKEPKRERDMHSDTRRSGTDIESIIPKLNCSNLDCNNTIDSVCGGKIEHRQWKYRLFLNECFFRKVNCYFKHGVNRYHRVPLDRCENVGVHVTARPSFPQLFPPAPARMPASVSVKNNNTRRNFSSRRSLTRSIDGKACSHVCPATCPDDYQPECAVSGTGQRKVFVNHCKLDYNSCTSGVVWYKRPLAECVGGKKADMRQNRGFIDWMQRVGIVDNKGRLILS